jgi:hypothetical protein
MTTVQNATSSHFCLFFERDHSPFFILLEKRRWDEFIAATRQTEQKPLTGLE